MKETNSLKRSPATPIRYNPVVKPNQLIIGDGNLVIVTGWTPKKTVAQKLPSTHYAAIGNLYSPMRGISFLVRNLLANPRFNHLLILDLTKEDENAGACACLYDFFAHGVREEDSPEDYVINSTIEGRIDKEIDSEALSDLCLNTHVTYYYPGSEKGLGPYPELAKRLNQKLRLRVQPSTSLVHAFSLCQKLIPKLRQGFDMDIE